jgi:hypothetical protein
VQAIEAPGCRVFFSSAVAAPGGGYRTVGTSRAVALVATAPAREQARAAVTAAAATVPVLEWRRDVGDTGYLDGLKRLVRDGPARAVPAVEG